MFCMGIDDPRVLGWESTEFFFKMLMLNIEQKLCVMELPLILVESSVTASVRVNVETYNLYFMYVWTPSYNVIKFLQGSSCPG